MSTTGCDQKYQKKKGGKVRQKGIIPQGDLGGFILTWIRRVAASNSDSQAASTEGPTLNSEKNIEVRAVKVSKESPIPGGLGWVQ